MVFSIVSTYNKGITSTVIPKAILKDEHLIIAHECHWTCSQFSNTSSKHIHVMGYHTSHGLNGED